MEILKKYYEIVFDLDQFLEAILTEENIIKFNLKKVYNDVIFAGNSIENLYDKQMTDSNTQFNDLINSLNNANSETSLVLKIDFFNQTRFEYLFNLIGFDYFSLLMGSFQIYKLDKYQCVYLQSGKRLSNDQNEIQNNSFKIDVNRLKFESNIKFCLKNFNRLNSFNGQPVISIEREGIDDDLYDQLETDFFSFLQKNKNEISDYIKAHQNNSNQNELENSGKYHFYNYKENNEYLNRELIYNNQHLKESKEKFINKFKDITASKLYEIIFKEYKNILEKGFDCRSKLISFLKNFIDQHNNCDFQNYLNRNCPLTYDNQNYLAKFTKQEDVTNYIKAILDLVIDSEIIGQANFIAIKKFITLIPFQNDNIKLYYSNFYIGVQFKELFWLKNIDILEKIKIIDLFIKWLSDYVIDLLKCSFYIVKENRLIFYRYDHWDKIHNNEIDYWLKNGMIKIDKRDNLNNSNNYIESEFKLILKNNQLEIHSSIVTNSLLEKKIILIGSLLKLICNDKTETFKNEIDFYNQIKKFYLQTSTTSNHIYYFRLKFQKILPNIDQTKLYEILINNLDKFSNKYHLNIYQLNKLTIYKKFEKIKKEDIYYLNLDNLDLIKILQLNGFEIEKSLIYLDEENYHIQLDLNSIKDLIFKFIKMNRLYLGNRIITMLKGLSFNKFLTKQMLILYFDDLVQKSLPNEFSEYTLNMEKFNFKWFIDEESLLILSDNQNYAIHHYRNLIQLLPDYNLILDNKQTFLDLEPTLNSAFDNLSECNFKNFILNLNDDPIIKYTNECFKFKNIKSSFSFNFYNQKIEFQINLIDNFLSHFKLFNLDADIFQFNDLIDILFAHFSLFAIQVLFFFEHSIQLSKKEDPKLLFDIIFDLLLNLFKLFKSYSTKFDVFSFSSSLNFNVIAWLLVQCFLLIWHNRLIEVNFLIQLENYLDENINEELKNRDLKEDHKRLFYNVDFNIPKRDRRFKNRSTSDMKRNRSRNDFRSRSRDRSRNRSRNSFRSRSRDRSRNRSRNSFRSRSRTRDKFRSRDRSRSFNRY